jgi:hypothetical protein
MTGSYLFVGHEFDGRLGCNLENVDAIAAPHRSDAALLQHVLEAAADGDVVVLGAIHLCTEAIKCHVGSQQRVTNRKEGRREHM